MTIPLDPRPTPLPDGQPWPTEPPDAPPTERPPGIVQLPLPKQPAIVSRARARPAGA